MKISTKLLSLSKLELNTGQIDGLPANPRIIKDHKYDQLKKSIEDDPEMLELREIIVIPLEKIFVVVAGNQRTSICKELGYKKVKCKILPADTPPDKLRAIALKDNVNYGEWDWQEMETNWDFTEMKDFGLNIPARIIMKQNFIDNPGLNDGDDDSGTATKAKGKKATKTDNDHSELSVIMLHTKKVDVVNFLHKEKSAGGYETLGETLYQTLKPLMDKS